MILVEGEIEVCAACTNSLGYNVAWSQAHPKCTVCGGTGEFFDSPTGAWWAHDVHPDDGHDFVAATK